MNIYCSLWATAKNYKLYWKMNKIGNYVKDSYRELAEKVTWPDWDQLQQSTMIVLVATIIITLVVWLMDFLAGGGLNLLYKILYS